jgi:peptidoglycan/xylan/chitin deacetylase (PgdA/CDA1 family)
VPGVCVLTLHRLVDTPERDHDVTWDAFGELLDRVAAVGAGVVSELDPPAGTNGRRRIVLTFDDGTADHLRAGEELARRGLPGIFFVPAGKVDSAGYLTQEEVRELQALGHVIGSHAYHHAPLEELSRSEVALELTRSRDLLSDLLETKIRYFAPPGGITNRFLSEELERHGFTASRSMRWGLYRSAEERWDVPCIPVTQVTLTRGWVARTLDRWELPAAMRSAWVVKRAMPAKLRFTLRSAAHERLRGTT